MEHRNNKQNSVVLQIEDLLNKMSNQVDFLIRKDESLNRLDVDLLMENTRRLYDVLCSVRCDEITEDEEIQEQVEIPGFNPFDEFIKDKFAEEEIESDIEDKEVEEEDELAEEEIIEEYEDEESDFEDEDAYIDSESEVNEEMENEEIEDEEAEDDDVEEEDIEEGEEIEIKEEPKEEEIRVFRRVRDESHTLIDKLEMTEDNSLVARLQKKPVADLTTAIGINDKFLFLNDLFNGSMEKYNKSIRALNSFSTLFGARTYMSELQIEFQWDCDSDAYKKLNDLVERRFIANP